MSEIGFILDRLDEQNDQPAIFWHGSAYNGSLLSKQVRRDIEFLVAAGITPGAVVLLRGDYSPQTVSMLLALIEMKTIVAPLLPATLAKTPSLLEIVDPAFLIDTDAEEHRVLERREPGEPHPLLRTLI